MSHETEPNRLAKAGKAARHHPARILGIGVTLAIVAVAVFLFVEAVPGPGSRAADRGAAGPPDHAAAAPAAVASAAKD